MTDRIVHTRYHSKDWEMLVERGYITMRVERNPCDETQTAIMLYHRGKQ